MEAENTDEGLAYKLGRTWGRLMRANRAEAAQAHWTETLSTEQRLELMKLERNPLRRSVVAIAFVAVIALFFLPIEMDVDVDGALKVDTGNSGYNYEIVLADWAIDDGINAVPTEYIFNGKRLPLFPGNVSISINGAEGKLTGKYHIKGPWISVLYAAHKLGGSKND